MNDSASTSTTKLGGEVQGGDAPDLCAVLLLDAAGRIVAANASAHRLWGVAEPTLAGRALASLFVFEVTSTDPEFLEAQWDVLLASALDRSATLAIQPTGAAASREVRVRLEKSLGAPAGYIATVQPRVANVSAAPSGENAAGFSLLADKGAVGFFDLVE